MRAEFLEFYAKNNNDILLRCPRLWNVKTRTRGAEVYRHSARSRFNSNFTFSRETQNRGTELCAKVVVNVVFALHPRRSVHKTQHTQTNTHTEREKKRSRILQTRMIPSLPTNASGHNATTRGGVNQERAIIRSSAQRDVRPEPEVSRVSACLPAYTRFTHAVRSPKTDVRSERPEFPWFQKKNARTYLTAFSFVFFLINLQMRLL